MEQDISNTIYTIGHSNHSMEKFATLLQKYGIEFLVDTRSQPYSKYCPWFDHDVLSRAVIASGFHYLFLGREMGGRPADRSMYDAEGHVLYSLVADSLEFKQATDRLLHGMVQFRIALMCGEEDPMDCHRRLLISRVLVQKDVQVQHIRGDGNLISEAELSLKRPLEEVHLQHSLFPECEKEEEWRSTQSVSRSAPPPASLELSKKRLIDVRLNNTSQLAGFAKKNDLEYFLRELCGIEYVHEPLFTPEPSAFEQFKKKKDMPWNDFESAFLNSMKERRIQDVIPKSSFKEPAVLLCSEETAEHCHRRLVAEYLKDQWGGVNIIHL